MKQLFMNPLKLMMMMVVSVGILSISSCNNRKDEVVTPVKPVTPETPVVPKDTTPKVTSLSSTTVSYGDTLVVNGDNFSTVSGDNKVTLSDVPASVIGSTVTTLKVIIPALTRTSNELKLKVGTSTVTGGTITYKPDVFVAGSLNNYAVSLATYWKNGKAVTLSQNESALNAISVNPTGVYVGGWERINNLQLANYWKNGAKTTLGTDASAVYAMAVIGTDVYAGGFEIISGFDLPRYWHNSTGTTINVTDPIISQNIIGNGACYGISYSGNTVYAVGYYRNSQGRFSPWETTNGEVPAKTIPNNDKHCFGNGAFLNGTDKYVAGTQNNPTTGLAMATVWKNGSSTTLTDGNNSVGIARAVFVVGGDVYVAGYEQENYSGGGLTFAKYWKNGVAVKLSTANSYATGIVVFDNDVYVVGSENNGTRDVVKYWKNGVAVSLTDGNFTSAGNSIFLR